MATTLPEPDIKPSESDAARSQLPNATALRDRTPEWFRTPATLSLFVFVLGTAWTFLNYVPLWHTDVWGHLAYGRFMVGSGTIPTTEPFMPLSTGVRFVDTAWLAQLVGYAAMAALGTAALHAVYATLITVCLGLLAWRLYRRTASVFWSLVGCGVFLAVNWQQFTIIRPQLAGVACFCFVLTTLTARRWHRSNLITIPCVFVVWANSHASFIVGLVLIGLFLIGRAADLVRRSKTPRALLSDVRVRRYGMLLQLASVAALMNPYGIELYANVLTIASNPNLQDLIEWEPLTLRMKQGQSAAVLALLLVFVYRCTPRRVSATEVLLLLGFGAWAMWTSRMINWWSPVAAFFFVQHGNAVWRRFRHAERKYPERSRTGLCTIVNLGLVWIFFGLSPVGTAIVHGVRPGRERGISHRTPVGAVMYLNEPDRKPTGLVFNSYEWGDYLLWAGRRDLQVFVASHAHLIPTEVWRDYLTIAAAGANWDERLARYGVNTVLADPVVQPKLIRRMRSDDEWRIGYEDERSVVFLRNEPIH